MWWAIRAMRQSIFYGDVPNAPGVGQLEVVAQDIGDTRISTGVREVLLFVGRLMVAVAKNFMVLLPYKSVSGVLVSC